MRTKVFYIQIAIIILALAGFYNILKADRPNYDNWMAPYLSAAHNLEFGGNFRIDTIEIKKFQKLDVNEKDSYKFIGTKNLSHYNHNPIGYAYIIRFATFVLPFLGDQMAILVFQCVIHVLISILFLTLKEFNSRQKWIFFILYSMNPLILRWAPINYYYFWQVIPSIAFTYLIISRSPNKFIIGLLFLILPFAVLTRPTIVLSLIFVFYLLYKNYSFNFFSIFLIYNVLICVVLFQPIKKNFWHTVFVGFGAYDNKYDIYLGDDRAYQLYENEMGEKLNVFVGGNYYEEEVIEQYTEIAKRESLLIIRDNPFLILKNAAVNTLEGYSIGYVNRGDWLNYLIALSGLAFVVLLIYYKMYIWFLMIGFSLGAFTLYYPPIGSYMYGVYLVSVMVFITLPSVHKIKKNFEESFIRSPLK